MIEAPEYVTPTQRKLHDRYTDIHRKFFPNPPIFSRPQQVAVPPVVIPEPEPEKPAAPKPLIAPGPPVSIDQTNLRLKIIKQIVCAEFNISQQALLTERRTQKFIMPRHMFYYLASRLTKASLPQLGRSLGGQDHSTALHAIRRMKVRVVDSQIIGDQARRLESILDRRFGDASKRHYWGRYVPHEKVEQYEQLGWLWQCVINEYAALMIWRCSCECVEPKE